MDSADKVKLTMHGPLVYMIKNQDLLLMCHVYPVLGSHFKFESACVPAEPVRTPE